MKTASQIWNNFISGKPKASTTNTSSNNLMISTRCLTSTDIPTGGGGFKSPYSRWGQETPSQKSGYMVSFQSPLKTDLQINKRSTSASLSRKIIVRSDYPRITEGKMNFYMNGNRFDSNFKKEIVEKRIETDPIIFNDQTNESAFGVEEKKQKKIFENKLKELRKERIKRMSFHFQSPQDTKQSSLIKDFLKKNENIFIRKKPSLPGSSKDSIFKREYLPIKTFDFKETFNFY